MLIPVLLEITESVIVTVAPLAALTAPPFFAVFSRIMQSSSVTELELPVTAIAPPAWLVVPLERVHPEIVRVEFPST